MTVKLKIFALQRTETPWEIGATWETLNEVRFPSCGDHLSDWKEAIAIFRNHVPEIMKDFGNGTLAVVLKSEEIYK